MTCKLWVTKQVGEDQVQGNRGLIMDMEELECYYFSSNLIFIWAHNALDKKSCLQLYIQENSFFMSYSRIIIFLLSF